MMDPWTVAIVLIEGITLFFLLQLSIAFGYLFFYRRKRVGTEASSLNLNVQRGGAKVRREANFQESVESIKGSIKEAEASPDDPERRQDEDPELEQERWNLPGFLSMQNVHPPEALVRPDFPLIFSSEERDAPGSPHEDRLEFFAFRDFPEDIHSFSDIEVFCKQFLRETEVWYPDANATIYLVGNGNAFRPVLEKRRSLYLSGDAIEDELPTDVAGRIFGGNPVLDDEGNTLYFPMLSNTVVIGVLKISSEGSLYNRDRMADAWMGIKRFSAFLYHAKLFEQVTKDAQSTLYNGMQFQKDLKETAQMREYFHVPFHLLLLQFRWKKQTEPGFTGVSLRAFFSEGKYYRISKDVYAILSPFTSGEKFQHTMVQYYEYLKSADIRMIAAGGSVLRFDIARDSDWFRRARMSLQESRQSSFPSLVLDEGNEMGIRTLPLVLSYETENEPPHRDKNYNASAKVRMS